MGNSLGKYALIALSLATFCMIRTWTDIIYSVWYFYHLHETPSSAIFWAALLNLAGLTGILWLAAALTKDSQSIWVRRLREWGFLLLFVVALNAIRIQIPILTGPALLKKLDKSALILIGALLASFSAFAMFRWYSKILRGAALLVLFAFPFSVLTISQGVWRLIHFDAQKFADRPNAVPHSKSSVEKGGKRVVWIIFDELEQRLAFEKRPKDLFLPTFDELRKESFSGTKVVTPDRSTMISMPSVILGQMLATSDPKGAGTLVVTTKSSDRSFRWEQQPNVFSKAYEQGYNTAMIGWYHPYCRMIGNTLTQCRWYSPNEVENPSGSFSRYALLQQVQALDTIPLVEKTRIYLQKKLGKTILLPIRAHSGKQHRLNIAQDSLAESKKMVTDPKLDLILLHMSVPHPPAVYDRHKNDYSLASHVTYIDNLALADRMLKELIESMKKAGLWDQTHLLVTSDHSLRVNSYDGVLDERVPFFLRIADQRKSLEYHQSFNTIITHDLLLELLQGKLTSPEAVAKWIRSRSAASHQSL